MLLGEIHGQYTPNRDMVVVDERFTERAVVQDRIAPSAM